MKVFKQPKKQQTGAGDVSGLVRDIIADVRQNGDQTLLSLTGKFDHVKLDGVRVSREEIAAAYEKVPADTLAAIRFAAEQIRIFAEKQLACLQPLSFTSRINGLELGHRLVPVDRCGCYVPGGRYPLPSSALMSIITAKTAGVASVAACSPASSVHGGIDPTTLAAMDIAGADEIFCMGGAQAIAAYAYGTQSVAPVDMIVGPGNRFVVEAKRQVMGEVGIDSLAGPSEVLIIADETAEPRYAAIDLLAQAEHDPNAKCVIVSTSEELLRGTAQAIAELLPGLSTSELAAQSWENNGLMLLADDMAEAIDYANKMAPEHLEVQTADERGVAARLRHYGSLFVGHYAPVAFGDFVSGTNHILPTMTTARFSNGLWVGSFIKTSFQQFVSPQGCANLADSCMRFAATEGLAAHHDSVKLRCDDLAARGISADETAPGQTARTSAYDPSFQYDGKR